MVAAGTGKGWGERLRRLLVLPLWLVPGWACPSWTPLLLVSATTIFPSPTPPPLQTTSPSRSLDTGWLASTPDPQNRTQGHQGPGPSQTDPALAPWGRGTAATQRAWAQGLPGAPGPAGCSFPLRAGLHPSRPPRHGGRQGAEPWLPVPDPQGTGTSRSVPLPVRGTSQVALGELCTSGQLRGGGGGMWCHGSRARLQSRLGLPRHCWASPLGAGAARGSRDRRGVPLDGSIAPRMPTVPSPTGLSLRPLAKKKGDARKKTKRKGQASVHPPWLQHGGSHVSAAVAAEGSIPASGAPGSGASSPGQRAEPRVPRWTHSQAPVCHGHEGGSRSGAHGPTLAETPAVPVASRVEGRSGMGRAFPRTRVPKHPHRSTTTTPTECVKAPVAPSPRARQLPESPLVCV